MSQCSHCNREFLNENALHAHCRDRADHDYCELCERLFVNSNALQQHLSSAAIHQQDTDEEEDEEDEEENYDESDDYDYSSDVDDSDDDSTEDDEEPPFCTSCARWFVSREGLTQHLANSSKHNWCFICSRDFSSAAALDQHSSSRVHKSRDLNCPLCSKSFKIPSAIALHIESGACHNINRHQVTAAVHSLKIVPTISITRRLRGAGNVTITSYSATELAFNGSTYECYLCHRTFRALNSLNAHLNSPAHDADEFRCPKCKGSFQLISGLIQHIESEVCGMAKFKQVEDQTMALTSQFARLLTY